jgi:hypothetical protein
VQTLKSSIAALVPGLRTLVRRVRPYLPGRATPPPKVSQVFGRIYAENYWGSVHSRSGRGSDLAQTEELRRALPPLLAELGARSMLDIPCGDFFWMARCELPVERYVGADIVPELIAALGARFADGRREFRRLDLIRDALPQVDLVFCRDALVHFSDADARRAIRNIKRSGSRFLLTTTFPGRAENPPIETGNWRPLNLERAPFGFPPPLRLIDEKCREGDGAWADKSVGLWRIADL